MKPIIMASAFALCVALSARTAGALEIYNAPKSLSSAARLVILTEDEDAWLHEHCSYQGTTMTAVPRDGVVHEFLFDSYGQPVSKEFSCSERPPFWDSAWTPAPADDVNCVGMKGTCTPPLASASVTQPMAAPSAAPVLPPVAKEHASRAAPTTLPASPPSAPKATRDSSAASTVGYLLIGTGVVSLVGAGVSGAIVLDAKSTMKTHCSGVMTCDSEGMNAARRGDTASTVATVAFGVGAAAIAGGVLLVVLDKPREKQVGVGAHPNAQGATFTIEGKF
ncbi:hypothetical protein [Labilithrix luteola]|nr:hypothetical protein [Labilithrix luteola]